MTLPCLLHRLRDQDHPHMEPPEQQQSHLDRDVGTGHRCSTSGAGGRPLFILLYAGVWAQ